MRNFVLENYKEIVIIKRVKRGVVGYFYYKEKNEF